MLFVSIIMVMSSSFLFANSLNEKKFPIVFLYQIIIAFSQVVLTLEILSLFNQIGRNQTLVMNVLFLLISYFIWCKKGKSICDISIKQYFSSLFNTLKRDKFLAMMMICFVCFVVTMMIWVIIWPQIDSYDWVVYRLARVPFFISQKNLLHTDFTDLRATIMPINSEILYTWFLLFTKKEYALGIFSYVAYFFFIVTFFQFAKFLGFSNRKRLYAIFVLSSFSSVIIFINSIELELIVAGLIFASLFFFLQSIKKKDHLYLVPLYFSTLCYALAFGTKSSTFFTVFASAIFIVLNLIYYKRKDFLKITLIYISFAIVNFIIFSSYNYILNFIDYGNFLGSAMMLNGHQFYGGFKGFIANIVRYLLRMYFDFTGFNTISVIGDKLQGLEIKILSFMKIEPNVCVSFYLPFTKNSNNISMTTTSCFGLFGSFIFIYSQICVGVKILINCVKRKPLSRQNFYYLLFITIFSINFLVLSGTMAYFFANIRFLTTFALISSIILIASYPSKKNWFLKGILIVLVFCYLLIYPFNIKPYTLKTYLTYIYKHGSLVSNSLPFESQIKLINYFEYVMPKEKKTKIGLIIDQIMDSSYFMKTRLTRSVQIDVLLFSKIYEYNLEKYDYIVLRKRLSTCHMPSEKTFYQMKKDHFKPFFTVHPLSHKIVFFKVSFPDSYIKEKGYKRVYTIEQGENPLIIYKKMMS